MANGGKKEGNFLCFKWERSIKRYCNWILRVAKSKNGAAVAVKQGEVPRHICPPAWIAPERPVWGKSHWIYPCFWWCRFWSGAFRSSSWGQLLLAASFGALFQGRREPFSGQLLRLSSSAPKFAPSSKWTSDSRIPPFSIWCRLRRRWLSWTLRLPKTKKEKEKLAAGIGEKYEIQPAKPVEDERQQEMYSHRENWEAVVARASEYYPAWPIGLTPLQLSRTREQWRGPCSGCPL